MTANAEGHLAIAVIFAIVFIIAVVAPVARWVYLCGLILNEVTGWRPRQSGMATRTGDLISDDNRTDGSPPRN
jgi:hypothetical protein